MTLRRQEKHRYVLVFCGNTEKWLETLSQSVVELFGAIMLARASLKVVSQRERYAIVRCSLYSFESVLCAMALCEPPILSLSSSGSVAKLKKAITTFEEDSDWNPMLS